MGRQDGFWWDKLLRKRNIVDKCDKAYKEKVMSIEGFINGNDQQGREKAIIIMNVYIIKDFKRNYLLRKIPSLDKPSISIFCSPIC